MPGEPCRQFRVHRSFAASCLRSPRLRADGGAGQTIVLGAGAVGTATAWFLPKSGHEVEVIERQPGPALETSWGNGGVIHASEVEPWSQPGMPRKILGWLGKEDAPLLVRYGPLPHIWRWGLSFVHNCTPERFRANSLSNLALALHSLRTLQEIAAETGIEYDRATRGVMKIYRSQDFLDAATRACETLARHGLTFERMDAPGCVAREPALGDTGATLAGGLYFPRDEVGDCNKFTHRSGRQMCGARRAPTTMERLSAESRLRAARWPASLPKRPGMPPTVLSSRSAPSPRRCCAKIGLAIPIYPVKGVSITFKRGAWNSAPVMPVIDDSKLFGLVPIGDRLRISGSAEVAGYDATPSEARGAAIVANASYTFPQLAAHYRRDEARLWAGLRPVTPSGTPVIGPTKIEGLWVNAGHGHLGWTLACGSGRVLADLVNGRDPKVPLGASSSDAGRPAN